MKKIISLFVLFFLFNACSIDNGEDYSLELLPVESVEIPTEFTFGKTYQITMHYNIPSTCHSFNSVYYDKTIESVTNKNIRTIAIESAVAQRNDCHTTTNNMTDYTFNFLVTSDEPYVFKFWQGEDDNGEDVFLEIEVPVN
jgi:PBP1b-binding outer membrane lipoprotein LpoB